MADLVDDTFMKSGATFETKVAKMFQDAEWKVKVKQYYIDPFEGKPREMDIIATKSARIGEKEQEACNQLAFGIRWGLYEMRVFIECKYLVREKTQKGKNVKIMRGLFMKKADREEQKRAFYRLWPNFVCSEGRNHPLYSLEAKHRYLAEEYIIYESTDNNGKDRETFGVPAVEQVVHGIMSETFQSGAEYHIDYPVIIAHDSDSIFTKKIDTWEITPLDKHSLFRFDYAQKMRGAPKRFVVDTLCFDHLPDFIGLLNQEFEDFYQAIYDYQVKESLR